MESVNPGHGINLIEADNRDIRHAHLWRQQGAAHHNHEIDIAGTRVRPQSLDQQICVSGNQGHDGLSFKDGDASITSELLYQITRSALEHTAQGWRS